MWSLCGRKWQVTEEGHHNRNNSTRNLSVLKRRVTAEDECLAHNGRTQARRAEVKSYVCWSVCFGEPSTLAGDKTLKVSLVGSPAPPCTCLYDPLQTKQGQRPVEKTVSNRPFPAVKQSQGLTFVEFIPKKERSSEIWFQNIISFFSGTFQQVNSQEAWIPDSSAFAILLWKLESKVIFLSVQGVWETSPVDPERKQTNKTKQNPETKTSMATHAPQFLGFMELPCHGGTKGQVHVQWKEWGWGGRAFLHLLWAPDLEKAYGNRGSMVFLGELYGATQNNACWHVCTSSTSRRYNFLLLCGSQMCVQGRA